ncbi:MAG: thiol-disulfide isomerase/thioredoxin [Planctomycetota bacterium]|jgi:thiol-disulfide isomerase/thioredoxin
MSPRILLLAILLVVLTPFSTAAPGGSDAEAQAVYVELLAQHGNAAAIDLVATVERRVERRDGGVARLLVEGEMHCAHRAAGWLRTSTVGLLPEGKPGDREPLPDSEGEPFELMGDGAQIYEVNRSDRTVLTLGERWFAVFPDLSPISAWTGIAQRAPRSVVFVSDPTGQGRRGLRIERGGQAKWSVGSTETLWLGEDGKLVAAEKIRHTNDHEVSSSFTLRSWELSKEANATLYERRPPAGFSGLSVLDQVEDTLLAAGSVVPPISLLGIGAGKEDLTLESLKGKAVLLTFWYVDCPEEREHLTRVQKLWAQVSGEREDVRFLGVALTDTPAETLAHWKAAGNTYPTYGQIFDEISRAFGVRRYPTTFLIGKTGKVLWRSTGFNDQAVRAILEATR